MTIISLPVYVGLFGFESLDPIREVDESLMYCTPYSVDTHVNRGLTAVFMSCLDCFFAVVLCPSNIYGHISMGTDL